MSCRSAVLYPAIVPDGIVHAEDLVTGLMRYGQEKKRVDTYPAFGLEPWQILLRSTQDAVPSLIPRSVRLEFYPAGKDRIPYPLLKGHKEIAQALSVIAPTDPKTRRMRLKLKSQHGIPMSGSFLALVEVMFVIGWRIDEFYQFN